MNLIRHPFTRINSLANTFHVELNKGTPEMAGAVADFLVDQNELVKNCSRRYDLDMNDPSARAFIAAACSIPRMVDELLYPQRRLGADHRFQIIMERMVSDKGYFAYVVENVTAATVKINSSYLELVFDQQKIEWEQVSHSKGRAYQCPHTTVEGWTLWQKEIVAQILEDTADTNVFSAYGYSTDFL